MLSTTCHFSHFPLSFSSTLLCVGAVFTSRCTEPETLEYKLTRLKWSFCHFSLCVCLCAFLFSGFLLCGCVVFIFCTPECVHTLSRECYRPLMWLLVGHLLPLFCITPPTCIRGWLAIDCCHLVGYPSHLVCPLKMYWLVNTFPPYSHRASLDCLH